MSWDVTVPDHEVVHQPTGRRYPVAGGTVEVSASDEEQARTEAARKLHGPANVPPLRSLLAQTAARATRARKRVTAADEQRERVARSGRGSGRNR